MSLPAEESVSPQNAAGERGRRWRCHLAAAFGFGLIIVVVCWPVVRHLQSRIMSNGGDAANVVWSWRHFQRALEHLRSPFSTDGMFYPVGANLAFHVFSPLLALVAWPLASAFGIGVAVNVIALASVFVSALAMYFLALRAGAGPAAAFVAGLAFGLCPYWFVHAPAHYTLLHTELLPLSFLAWLRLVDRPTRGRGALFGVAVAALYLTDLYLFALTIGALAVFAACRTTDLDRGQLRRPLAWAVGVAGVIVSPLVAAQVAALGHGELPTLPGWGGADFYSADLLSWFVPPHRHTLWGGTRPVWAGSGETYVGYTVLVLALVGVRLGQASRRRGWAALAVVSATLALGPFLHIAGRTGTLFHLRARRFSIPLPWMAVSYLPVLNGLRAPQRLAVVVEFALAALMAIGLTELGRRLPRRAPAIAALAGGLVLIEFLPGPIPQEPVKVPSPYLAIAAQHGGGAILELPLQWSTGTDVIGDVVNEDSIFLYYDSITTNPVVNGSVARYPHSRLNTLLRIPIYRQVAALGSDPGFTDQAVFTAQELRTQGIGYVVYHRNVAQPRVYAYIQNLRLPVLADDGNIIVWKVSQALTETDAANQPAAVRSRRRNCC